jgi:hypothetical protein
MIETAATKPIRPSFTLILRAETGSRWRSPAHKRLAMALKTLLRAYGMRCVSAVPGDAGPLSPAKPEEPYRPAAPCGEPDPGIKAPEAMPAWLLPLLAASEPLPATLTPPGPASAVKGAQTAKEGFSFNNNGNRA